MSTRRGFGKLSGSRVVVAGGAAVVMVASVVGAAVPAGSEPMSRPGSAGMNPFGEGPFSPFTSSSGLEVASIGDGRAVVGRPSPFPSVSNPASRALKKLPSQVELDAAMRKALRGLVWSPKPDPIPDDLWRQIDEITAIAGAAPIIGRLPVDFDTFEVGKAFREEVKFDDSIWKGADFPYGSNDPKIAQASLRAYGSFSNDPAFTGRAIDLGLAYGAVDSVLDGAAKPMASGVEATGEQFFAQLGVTPFVRLFATGPEARDLYERGILADVSLDSASDLLLDDTVESIEADRYLPQYRGRWNPELEYSASGRFTTVAVIDTGVDLDGPGIPRNRIVDGACFLACGGEGGERFRVSMESSDPGDQLVFSGRFDHGTHVAGIIAAQSSALPNGDPIPAGVAPAARIASYKVCLPSFDLDASAAAGATVWRPSCPASAQTQALGRTTTKANELNIAAANISLESPNKYRRCPNKLRDKAYAAAVGAASAAGVSVVNANGNDGRFMWANCDPTMIVVGSATKTGAPSGFSDFHPDRTTLWAPGSNIRAVSIDDSGTPNVESKSGTSMAAPHVAGAIALIAQSLRDHNRNGARSSRDQVTMGQIRDLMLGIATGDSARVVIPDNRPGTDSQGDTASGRGAALLSLRNLWMLLQGPPIRALTSVPTYTVPNVSASVPSTPTVADLTPAEWTVTTDSVRKEYNGGAIPLRGDMSVTYGRGNWLFSALNPARLAPLSGRTILDGPYLYAYSANGSLASVQDSVGNELPIQQIAKGPQPCTRAGWLEIIRVPVTAAQHDSEDFVIRVEGPEPRVVFQVEATVDSGNTTQAVATDPRPLVFGGSRTFPDPVDLGAHRPDITNTRAWINWFDLDRITGDELMLNDASNAGSYWQLRGTRVPNDAVAQDFFYAPQTSMLVGIPSGTNESIIGWQETAGYQDCAVALGHIWMGRQ